jgi:hypothetical protein
MEMNMKQLIEAAIKDNIEAALPDGVVIDYHYAACQVLNVMREPSLAMVDAGADYLHKTAPFTLQESEARAIYQAMIDAAK